ncbi:MAG: hypothetical protein KKE94_10680 [Gammaproteobacteria bacterium]|nr:hypothetical protein [Gammaproteobacteria bacterium]
MDNVISLMERLGADCRLNADILEALKNQPLESADITAAVRDADIAKLEMLLNVRNKIVCMVFPVEEPKERPNEPEEDDKPEEVKTTIAV